ncbi:hypothetical protein J4H72_17720 [Vibrio alginolyticus]|uniref:hypothetical protein n=1 Tax=Vibrio alginolyticus TaxID=663 RepID=UPI001BD5E7DB|nr:hypothetical protein [Vibrio alginolyticus]MBT0109533.1 hypothetical protein [Vibrio alginolyticus]
MLTSKQFHESETFKSIRRKAQTIFERVEIVTSDSTSTQSLEVGEYVEKFLRSVWLMGKYNGWQIFFLVPTSVGYRFNRNDDATACYCRHSLKTLIHFMDRIDIYIEAIDSLPDIREYFDHATLSPPEELFDETGMMFQPMSYRSLEKYHTRQYRDSINYIYEQFKIEYQQLSNIGYKSFYFQFHVNIQIYSIEDLVLAKLELNRLKSIRSKGVDPVS